MRFWVLLFASVAYAAVKRATLPENVFVASIPHTEEHVSLQIALKLQNLENLESMLRERSDPDSPGYGNYLDSADVNATFHPSNDSRDAVLKWLKDAGVKHFADHGYYINFAATVGKANELLGSSFQSKWLTKT